jgi:hypothetical protein
MGKDLRMEVFASKDVVKPVILHIYQLHSQKIDNSFSIIRGAVWKLKNYNHVGVFEDGNRIYSTDMLDESVPNADFTIEYEGIRKLEVLENRKVYCELIKYLITKNLSEVLIYNKYHKYSCKSSVTSKWIRTENDFNLFTSDNKEISLERKYNFWVDIMDDGKAYLRIDTSSAFMSNLTVYDYMERGINPVGMEVKNDWAKNNQTGILTEICDFTVTDKLDFADSLKAYYINKKEGKRVEQLPDDTKVVKVELQSDKTYPYYPQALKPVLTREKVGQIDPQFSVRIEPYVKRDMRTRLMLDQDFIGDIGVLKEINSLQFDLEPCEVKNIGYSRGAVPLPKLICGKDRVLEVGKEFQVFNYGFYRKPDREIKIGYLYPKNQEHLMKVVVNEIYSFAKLGKYQGEKDKYIISGLLDIKSEPMIKEEYELGDITDYKRAANRLHKIEGIDIVIALIPDGIDEDGPYNPFKTIWAKANIPSQMISMKTAELFARGKAEGNKSKYYLHNIILGILGKTGGIPWIVKDMPGNVDCFVGLDVATVAKGIHYPACSVLFDKYGRLLGFYKPTTPQQGEKITTRILQDIFDQVIFSYEDRFGESPKNVVIHRDGFSNENDEWYKNYFGAKGIEYSIIEIRKNISSKLILIRDGNIENPTMGYCVYNDSKGCLVTTDMKNKKGSPNPILVEKKCGNISMADILTQILYLSQLHVGSTHKMRLPITTGYADKICKNRDFVPEGKMDDRLFFL